MAHRQGEEERTHFRSDRFFIENGQWFFFTREATISGPFMNKKEAEAELTLYIRRLLEFPHEALKVAQ
ncbi:MAG: DUF6316 family protein [Cellvibrionaceae bacterium]